jgi:hypothetical protein
VTKFKKDKKTVIQGKEEFVNWVYEYFIPFINLNPQLSDIVELLSDEDNFKKIIDETFDKFCSNGTYTGTKERVKSKLIYCFIKLLKKRYVNFDYDINV